MLQIIGISLATLICYVVLREKSPQFALVVSLAGVCIVLGIGMHQLKELSKELGEVISEIPTTVTYVKLMIKALLIVILTQITTDICRENGQGALSTIIEITAKIIIISMVIPLLKTILTLILGLIK